MTTARPNSISGVSDLIGWDCSSAQGREVQVTATGSYSWRLEKGGAVVAGPYPVAAPGVLPLPGELEGPQVIQVGAGCTLMLVTLAPVTYVTVTPTVYATVEPKA